MFVLCRQYLKRVAYYDARRYLKLDIRLLIGNHYSDGLMSAMISQIASLTIVYSTVY